MGVLLNVNGGHVFLRVVNVTCTDLAWFIFTLHWRTILRGRRGEYADDGLQVRDLR